MKRNLGVLENFPTFLFYDNFSGRSAISLGKLRGRIISVHDHFSTEGVDDFGTT